MKTLYLLAFLVLNTAYSFGQCTYTAMETSPACGSSCNGSVLFTASGGNAPYFLNISAGPQVAFSSSYTWTTACSGWQYYSVTDAFGNCHYVGAVFVSSVPSFASSISASGSTTICSGGSVLLSASPTGAGYTYQWKKDGSNLAGITAASYTAAAAGSYTCVVNNGLCQTTSNSISVTVTAAPPASISANESTTVCAPATVSLSANTGAGLSYQWRHNGNPIAGAIGSTYNAAATGSYNCMVSNSCGSTVSNSIIVTVNTTPSAITSVSGPTAGVCRTTQSYTAATAVGATSYTWVAPAGATITSGQGAATVSVSYSNSFSNGVLTVTPGNTCGNGSSYAASVASVPSQPGTISGPSSVCRSQSNVFYSIAPIPGATSYTWLVPSKTKILSGQGTTTLKVKFGTIAGNITVKANNACGSGPLQTLAISMPCRSADEEIAGQANLTYYPNPARHVLNMETTNLALPADLKIVNMMGQTVYSEQLIQESITADITKLPAGLYLITVTSNNGEQLIKKMVVEQ
jgi:hypothetical protein